MPYWIVCNFFSSLINLPIIIICLGSISLLQISIFIIFIFFTFITFYELFRYEFYNTYPTIYFHTCSVKCNITKDTTLNYIVLLVYLIWMDLILEYRCVLHTKTFKVISMPIKIWKCKKQKNMCLHMT